ncbi:unnamed protein product, partial [Hapterophycus canaliculatus]
YSSNQPRPRKPQMPPCWRRERRRAAAAAATAAEAEAAYFAATHGQRQSEGESRVPSNGGRMKPTPATAVNGRKKKHRTIKGRAIAKGGKNRGLWRSIFGPKPLLEVHSVDQLSQLIDVEGWGLEDLSVLTGSGGGSARSTERADSPETPADAVAAAVPAELDGPARSVAAAAVAGAPRKAEHGEGATTATNSSSEDDGDEGAAGASEVEGTAAQPQPRPLHPSMQAVLDRAAAGTKPSEHGDGRRIGLAIEGGGMRGCVAAGMASCLHYLGVADSFDSVYGASAGSLIGAYFVSRQSNGTAVYHDVLPSAGSRFIDMAKFPQALGFEMPKVPRKGSSSGGASKDMSGDELRALQDARAASFARVIGLDFLLEDVVGRVHALDFDAFSANDNLQPLHIVVSEGRPIEMVPSALADVSVSDSDDCDIMAAAAASTPVGGEVREGSKGGPPTVGSEVDGSSELAMAPPQAGSMDGDQTWKTEGGGSNGIAAEKYVKNGAVAAEEEAGVAATAAAAAALDCSARREEGGGDATELLVDAMVFEPLPYRSAIEDGCTDVVVLCTRPEGSQVLGK